MSSPRYFARALRRWLAASKARAEQLMETAAVRKHDSRGSKGCLALSREPAPLCNYKCK